MGVVGGGGLQRWGVTEDPAREDVEDRNASVASSLRIVAVLPHLSRTGLVALAPLAGARRLLAPRARADSPWTGLQVTNARGIWLLRVRLLGCTVAARELGPE
jgi:hypothetical protein